MKHILYTLLFIFFFQPPSYSHGGRVDQYGCHHDKKNNEYHCHRGELAGMQFSSKDEMLEFLSEKKKKSNDENLDPAPNGPSSILPLKN